MEKIGQENIPIASPEAIVKAARGSMIGAFVGDALGAPLEYGRGEVSLKDVEQALEFTFVNTKGGIQVGHGQVTDDSEMAICIAHAFAESGPSTLDVRLLEKYFALWMGSKNPFMGKTTRVSLAAASAESPNPAALYERTKKECPDSQSNGGLMRCYPIGIWCRNLTV